MDADVRPGLASVLPRLRRFGLALTGSVADADDLAQMACERALRRVDQLRDVARLDAWLYGIMRHLWLDERRARRVRQHESLEEHEDVPGSDGRPLTEDRLELARVRDCLRTMSPDHRAVLTLVCVDGLGYREAATVLDVPIGTIMSRLARARRDLHEKLATQAVARGGAVLPLTPPLNRVQP